MEKDENNYCIQLSYNIKPVITEDFRKNILHVYFGKKVSIVHRYRGDKGIVIEDLICVIDSRIKKVVEKMSDDIKKYEGKVYSILLEGYNLGDVEIKGDEREDLTNILADEYVGKTVEITIRVIK